ncbi:MAG TPA: methylated-DNA--[protein]-cysteine S-methyltransferase [Verrucomicrobiota bacterium]|nr:methylated-DNA--[protein]-cysteine S-methyltransferase [Verrucomicrobiota bacterium]HJO54544.1 methylated-DNA--[protein]-cysteine S-methyltransferase [Verrucomicrobiota bacterium]
MTSAAPIATRHGTFVAQFNDIGLCRLDFPGKARGPKPAQKPTGLGKRWLAATAAALESLLLGRAPSRLPPLDLSAGTGFQQTVWAELLNILPGQTRSYGEIAERLAKPGAARAVGSACGANPIPVIIPCHRVLAAHRRIGGFSVGPGWKQRLLHIEQAEFVG